MNNSLENVNKQDVADVGDTLIKSVDRLSGSVPFIWAPVPISAQQNFHPLLLVSESGLKNCGKLGVKDRLFKLWLNDVSWSERPQCT